MRAFHRSTLHALLLAALATAASAQVYERIDVNDLGQPPNAGAWATGGISDDGRFVAFISDATNFGGPDVANTRDVFVRDRQNHTTKRITSSLNAASLDWYRVATISGDGSTIGFVLYMNIPFGPARSFTYDVATATSREIVIPGVTSLEIVALSLDGRFAAVNAMTTSVPATQVYRLDLEQRGLVLCSRTPAGVPVGGTAADIDDDGTHLSFESTSGSIVPGDTNGKLDIFVLDIPSATIERASVATNGEGGNDESRFSSLSGNGRYVSMLSLASNFTLGDTAGSADVFLRDLRLGTTTRMNLTSQQISINAQLVGTSVSDDGTSVTFASLHPTGPADTGISLDVFLRDLETGSLLPVSPGDAISSADSFTFGLTADGRSALFFSYQQSIAAPIGPGVFVAVFGPRCSTSGYCTSLPNSSGKAATIGAQGDASRALNNLVISAVGLPDTAITMLVSGTGAVDPGVPFGNGLMCVSGTLIRHGINTANGGVVLDAQDMHGAEYVGVTPGDTRYYQFVYRDPPAGGALFNTTDAVAVTFCW